MEAFYYLRPKQLKNVLIFSRASHACQDAFGSMPVDGLDTELRKCVAERFPIEKEKFSWAEWFKTAEGQKYLKLWREQFGIDWEKELL